MVELSKNDLINRWKTPEGKKRRDTIVKYLLSGASLDKLGYVEKNENYYDLRGITFECKTSFDNIAVKNINFMYADLNKMVVDGTTIENVIFDEANGTGMLHYSSNFKNCRFSKANLKNSGFGIDGTRYHNTLFNNANFKGTTFHNGTFTDCTFSDCKLDGVDFDSSHFINVKFTGKLDDVWFRGENPDKEELQEERVKGHGLNPMLVDFSGAELVDVVFSDNCDLTKVVLPNDGNHILIMNWDKVLDKLDKIVDSEFSDDECRKEAHLFIKSYKPHAATQNMMILNTKTLDADIYKYLKEKAEEYRERLISLIIQINKQFLTK